MEPLCGVEDAARLLGISPWTVRARIHEGKLHPVRLGRRVLLEQAEIRRFVEEARRVKEPGQKEDNNERAQQ
jgi:excisionase family DNA binding protein